MSLYHVTTDMCRKMARTGNSSSDESDTEVSGQWRRPPPSDDECDETITLKSHHLRSLQRDPNIVLNIRVMMLLCNNKNSHYYRNDNKSVSAFIPHCVCLLLRCIS